MRLQAVLFTSIIALTGTSAASAADGWKPFISKRAGFRVLTLRPFHESTMQEGGQDSPVLTHTFTALSNPTTFFVHYIDYPKDGIEMFGAGAALRVFQENVVRSAGGLVTSEREVRANGVKMHEVRLTAKKTGRHVIMRYGLVGLRLYAITTSTSPETQDSEAVAKFFKSFAVLPEQVARAKADAGASAKLRTRTEVAAEPAPAAAPGWDEFRDPAGAFRVLAPKPLTYAREESASREHTVKHRFRCVVNADKPGETVYSVRYSEFPAGRIRALADNLARRLPEKESATLVSRRAISIQGFPAEELRFRDPDGVPITARFCRANGRLFELTVVGTKFEAPDTRRFLDSFRILSADESPLAASPSSSPRDHAHVASEPATAPAGTKARAGAWQDVAMKDGSFTVSLPGIPSRKMGTVKDNAREPFYRWTLVTKSEIYVVVFAPNSRMNEGKQTPDEFLAPFRLEGDGNTKEVLTDAKDVKVGGHAGRQYHTFRSDGFSLLERTVNADGGFYYLGVLTPVDGSYSENSLRFLSSLKLVPAAASAKR